VRRRDGLFVLLVGPDGSGKSTLAPKILEAFRNSVPITKHMHWRPGVLPRAGSLVGSGGGDPSRPHGQEAHSRVLSIGLLSYYWVDFFLGTWLRVIPVRARGGLVIVERGWWDYAVDPRRYRLAVSPKIVRFLGGLLPAPDVVLILEAKPETLHRRKRELPVEELSSQMEHWRRLKLPKRSRRMYLDVSQSLEDVVEIAHERIRKSMKSGGGVPG
jgi:energy-coupling factor transporter ATP-binding protein EcfA2